MAQAQQASRPV